MSLQHRAAAVAAVLLLSLFLPIAFPVAAAEAGPQTLTLYGGLSPNGWGLTSGSVDDPGPNITVFAGYPLTLMLNSLDDAAIDHDWFIDYDGDGNREPGEPGSDVFDAASPTSFSLTPDRIGPWTYRCSFHPGQMTGTIQVVAQMNVTLYGNASRGWGLSNATIDSPGPRIALVSGTNVTFQLIANDTDRHNFFIDYNGDRQPSGGERKTDDFRAATPLTVVIPLDRGGNFTYYCQYHGLMQGNVFIVGPPPPTGGTLALIPGILIIALAGVLVFAVVYEVRARRAAKRR